jgi:FKBP-type peptidyl-prolyl cis-trans isomerase FklB
MTIKQTKNTILFLGLFLLAGPAIAQQKPAVNTPEEKPVFKTLKEKQSYAMGTEMLRNLKRQKFDFDLNFVIRGMKDADAGGKLALTDDETLEMLNISASEARMMKTGDQLVAGLENKKAEEEFLAQNESKEGVVKLPSGLQYKIIKDGNGKKPTSEDSVQVNYRGTLVDGAQFENTYESGKPASIKVSDPHVIAGLREALKLMPAGAKWQLFIPSRLAYGQRPSGKGIGPYSMLIYELDVLSIQSNP